MRCGDVSDTSMLHGLLQPSGHGVYRQFTAQRSLYVPPVYSPAVTICTARLHPSCHYMYRQFTAQRSLSAPPVYSLAVTICTASLQPSGHYMYRQFTAQRSLYVPPVQHSQILHSAHTVKYCVLCGSENKQRLFPYAALTDWFLLCLLCGTD
jgi:hypothetical protein